MRERGAQEVIEPGQGRDNEHDFKNVGDRLTQGEQTADRPAGGDAGADELGSD